MKSALRLSLLWPNHAIKHRISWSTQTLVMASYIMAPSHYLKQYGLIIKLVDKVLCHLSQWIIMKDMKIPISKMRLKLIRWDNFTPSHEMIHLFSCDNSFVCVVMVSWYLLSPSLIPLVSVYSGGTRYPTHCRLWPHHRGVMSQELNRKTNLLHKESVEWKIMTSSIAAKIWKRLVN